MPGELVSANGKGAELRLDSGVAVRVATGAEQFEVGERCYAVVRPEKLRINRSKSPVATIRRMSRDWLRAPYTLERRRSSWSVCRTAWR